MRDLAYGTINEALRFITDTPKTALYVFLVTMFSTYYIILKCRRDPRLVEFSKTIPGPKGLPLIGNSLPFFFSGIKDFNKVLSDYSEKYGSVYKFWLGNELVVGLSDVDHLKVVFSSTKALAKPKVIFQGYKEYYGNALFTTSIPIWRQTRKRIQPTLWKNSMKSQLPSIQEHVDKFIHRLENHVNDNEVNVKDYLQNLSIDIFSGIFYNLHMTSTEKEYFKFYEIFDFSAIYAISKAIFPWLRPKILTKLYFGNQMEKQNDKLREFFNRLKITEEAEEVDINDDDVNLGRLFLSTIQNLEKEMKVKDYAYNETTNFMVVVAGSTTKALSFLLLAIAMHPDIQEKLFNEINSILGDDDRPVNMDDLSKFVYLDQVCKESQRRFTLIRDIFREVEEDIEIGSMIIPAKTTIMLRLGDVHMNPDLYPNPEQFNPENFSAEAIDKRSKYSFLAFSKGIRDCIGKYFADYVAKLTVISILRRFKLSTSFQMKDIDYTGTFSVDNRGGYWIKLESRR